MAVYGSLWDFLEFMMILWRFYGIFLGCMDDFYGDQMGLVSRNQGLLSDLIGISPFVEFEPLNCWLIPVMNDGFRSVQHTWIIP